MGHANAHALTRVPSQFSIHVHPSQSNDILQAVREQLAGLLLKYSEDLQGVVLAFYNERVLSKQAEVDPYFPFLHVEVAADVLLFQPRPGMQLVGSVNQVGHDYISVLVLGVFNAAIGAEHIRKDWRPQPQDQCWVNKRQPGEVIGLGSSVCFTVQRVLDHVSLFSLAGALLEPGTGLVAGQQQQQQQPHKQKKHKDTKQQQQTGADAGAGAAAAEGGKKRKQDAQQQEQQQHLNGGSGKKQKRSKEAAAEQQQAPGQPAPGAEQLPGHVPKKQKHKKQKDQGGGQQQQQQQQQVAAKKASAGKKGGKQQQQAGQANGHMRSPPKEQSQQQQENSKKSKHKKQKQPQQVPS